MANKELLKILKKGVESWNQWRSVNPEHLIDLTDADLNEAILSRANLQKVNLTRATMKGANLINADLAGATLSAASIAGADLQGADLSGADLRWANFFHSHLLRANLNRANLFKANFIHAQLIEANVIEGNLSGADLFEADLRRANLREANLSGAELRGANLRETNLSGADLQGADLERAILIQTNLEKARLTNCNIYGISAWDVKVDEETEQQDLIITTYNEPSITVDNLEVAQFVYLLLHNKKTRDVLDTIGQKAVLILGRFTKERKAVLDAIRNKLRELGFVPILFDFERPTQRDFTETIKTLAGLSRFVIADITNPKSSPLELQATVPDYMIPFVPICDEKEEPFSMFLDLQNKYSWVLDVLEYDSCGHLIKVMEKAVVKPALQMADQLVLKKAKTLSKRHVKDYR